ncbi:MAG: flagellar biosynthesis protein FlgA, partial [Alphaproteobacteria bacterium]|nr:flagellar biosynthesis protein FlgA [Alphaproteobacteria bacterium]
MNLSAMLSSRIQNNRPVRVGLIGAGKFGSMILSQARHINGLHIMAVADLDLNKAQDSFQRVGWDTKSCFAGSAAEAVISGKTWLTDNAADICALSELDCIIEATGHPLFGVRHAMMALQQAKHVVMVNVEADVLCGPYLTQLADENNVIFSMAYGDQPAAICELVDWVRTNGFELISAGKGMNFQPHFRYSTPDTVWSYFGWSDEEVAAGDFNPKMYNSFTDGTKAAIEMAAVANATGLDCPDDGLAFYPAGLHD